MQLETLNIIYNKEAKKLILEKSREVIAFPFILVLPYILSFDQVLNSTKEIN